MEYLTVKQAAEIMNISVMSVYRLHGKGDIPFTRIGGATRISRAAMERYLDKQTR